MRILHTADIHVGNNRFARPGQPWSRLADIDAILENFVAVARKAEADLAIVSGDLFDNRTPKPREWTKVVRFVRAVTEVCPLVITDGNHDGPSIINDSSSRTLQPLRAANLPGLYMACCGPGTLDVAGALVVTVPYPHKRAMEDNERAAVALDEGVRTLLAHAERTRDNPDAPIIFAGHLTVAGATVGSERAMRLSDDVTLSADVLDGFDYAALGHIHKQQQVGPTAWYPGSPVFIDFGEAGDPKSFLLAEVAAGRKPVVTPVPSGDRPMKVGYVNDLDGSLNDAIVRATVADQSEVRETLRSLYERGAQYAEVVVDSTPVDVAHLPERAIAVGLEPAAALERWLALNTKEEERSRYREHAQEVINA